MAWYSWLQILPVLAFLTLGLSSGYLVERAHFRRLNRAERELADIVVTDLSTLGVAAEPRSAELVCGEVVIATDYFKTFMAYLRKLVGGELRTYESLMERGRREAVLRMLLEARRLGADAVINVRLSSSSISGFSRKQVPMVEVSAYGTAIRRQHGEVD